MSSVSYFRALTAIVLAPLGLAATAQSSAVDRITFKFGGSVQSEVAHTTESPTHWSKIKFRTDLFATGKLGDQVKFRVSGSASTDFASRVEKDVYPRSLDKDQRFDGQLREAYIDVAAENLSFRIGRQYINWGEAVGVFVADVVNARDLREFILPDFDQIRIGQWAMRTDWQGDDKQAELILIPVPSYDEIGLPGSEFYPQLPSVDGLSTRVRGVEKPKRSSGGNWGIRGGFLANGWDIATFHYSSRDSSVSFSREINNSELVVTPRFGSRIHQTGLTVSKDIDWAIVKFESVYTKGRDYTVLRASDADGLLKQNTVDWLLGLDFPVPDSEIRVNLQALQRGILDRDPDLLQKRNQNFASAQIVYPAGKFEMSLLGIHNLNENEWLLRTKVSYKLAKNTRAILGADFIEGPAFGVLGQYTKKDRVYATLKHSF
jgi:hypothetical protein